MEPVRKSVTVNKSPKEAFALFTERFATWWPQDALGGAGAGPDVRSGDAPGHP